LENRNRQRYFRKTKKSWENQSLHKEPKVPSISKPYITEIKQILKDARAKAYVAVNYSMVEAY